MPGYSSNNYSRQSKLKRSFEEDGTLREARLRLNKQAVLMLPAHLKKVAESRAINPRNYLMLNAQNPFEIINKLFLPKDENGNTIPADLLFDLNNAELSALVPKIRLYKVVFPPSSEGGERKGIPVEIPFDDHTKSQNIENITESAAGRGGGVGLKSFQLYSMGTNPENVNLMGVEIKLFFQSIEDLFVKRIDLPEELNLKDDQKKEGIRFADLLVQQNKLKKSTDREEVYNEEYFRLQAVIGWASPIGEFWEGSRGRKIKNVLERNVVRMSLSLHSHEIDFRENGSLEVNIKYISSIEGIMNTETANILRHKDPGFRNARKEDQEELATKQQLYKEREGSTANSNPASTSPPVPSPPETKSDDESNEKPDRLLAEIEELQTRVNSFKIVEKNMKYSFMFKSIMDSGKLYNIKIDKYNLHKISFFVLSEKTKLEKKLLTPAEYELIRKDTAAANRSLSKRRAQIVGSRDISQVEVEEQEVFTSRYEQDLKDCAEGALTSANAQRMCELAVEKRKREGYYDEESADDQSERNKIEGYAQLSDDLAGLPDEQRQEFLDNSAKDLQGTLDSTGADIRRSTEESADREAELTTSDNSALLLARDDKVNFILLGDLLDIVLDTLFLEEGGKEDGFLNKKIKMILGPFTYTDYGETPDGVRGNGTVVKNRDGQNVLLLTGKQKTINLAQIPISMEMFDNWFRSAVMAPGKEEYYFSNFIRDLLTDLVPMCLGNNYYEFAPKQKVRFTMLPIQVPIPTGKKSYFESFGKEKSKKTKRNFVRNVEELPEKSFSGGGDSQLFENVLYFYAETESPFRLKGDYEEDINRGIYHFYWGADTGLVKSIQFSREDQPFLRESNIAAGAAQGSLSSGRILREKYNAALSLYGNNLFYPGQKIFVNPSVQTLGHPQNARSRIRELGFGGYYDVIKVTSIIEPGVFETKLETKWQSFGDGSFVDGERVDGDVRPDKVKII